MGNNTSVVGAGLGAAVGTIVVYLAEVLATTDIPTAVEGAIVVVATSLVAYAVPPSRPTDAR
jgi:hypothetical protein